MLLVTPEQIIVLLDLPADTAPTDRAQLACDLVTAAITARAPGRVLAEPYPVDLPGIALLAAVRIFDNPTALRSYTTGGTTQTYGGDVARLLTEDEEQQVDAAFGTSSTAPAGAFPLAQPWPDPICIPWRTA